MIILTGPSASGKTEVAKVLFINYGIKKVITHTTRKIRISEKPDVDYHFVTKEEFIKLNDEDSFVETTLYNDNYYGTSKKEIADDKVLIVDPNGVKSFLALNDPRIIVFRLGAHPTTRFNRMIIRGDAINDIEERLKRDVTVFNDSNFEGVHYSINTEEMTIVEVADTVFKLYQDTLAKLS